jgi:glycosidase
MDAKQLFKKMNTTQKNRCTKKRSRIRFYTIVWKQNTTNKPWGTIEENGVGKFNDFTATALHEIKDLGVTHIWYTGVPHHVLIRLYCYWNSNDDPEVVKGRAGSPYAVKDYYNVNPDLAVNPKRQEFEARIDRTHQVGLKVIIDIVPITLSVNMKVKTTRRCSGILLMMITVEYKEITTFIIFQRRNLKFHANAPLNGEVLSIG